MEQFENFSDSIPLEWYKTRDCWMVSKKIIALLNGRNYEALDLNAYFYYNNDAEVGNFSEGFCNIIRKNISLVEERNMVPEIKREYDFIKQFIGMNCEGKNCNGEEAFALCQKAFSKGASCVLWIDTFYAEWNGMFEQVHFPHCVTLIKLARDKSVIIDTFREESASFEIDNTKLFSITNSVNIFIKNKGFEEFTNIDEMIYVFMRDFVLKYDAIVEYIKGIENLTNDLIKLKDNINEVNDENVIKLMMRIFVNQHQKGVAQTKIMKRAEFVEEKILALCDEINNLWGVCAGIFAKIFYLPTERRSLKYNILCQSLLEIKRKLEIFDKIIKEKERKDD